MKKRKKLILGVVVIFFVAAVLVALVSTGIIKLNSSDSSLNNDNNQSIPSNDQSDLIDDGENIVVTADKVSELFKNYEISVGFYDVDNTVYFDLTTVKYLGYYENDPDTRYYVLTGSFKCLDETDRCVYVEQELKSSLDSKYDYVGAVSLVEEDGVLVVSAILPANFEHQVKNDPSEETGFIFTEEMLS